MKVTLLLLIAAMLVMVNTISGLKCNCNTRESICINSTCEINIGGCQVYIQHGKLFQLCYQHFFAAARCNDNLEINSLNSSIPYLYCCKEDLCNTEEVLFSNIPPEILTSLLKTTATTTVIATQTTTTTTTTFNTTATTAATTTTTTTNTGIVVTTTGTTSPIMMSTEVENTWSTTSATQIQTFTDDSATNISEGPPDYAIAIIVILATLLVLFIAMIFIVVFLRFYPRHVIGAMSVEGDGTPNCTLSTESGELEMFKNIYEGTATSGSGSGLPLLIQRSVAAQVTLLEVVGKGKFGEVRRGTYKGDQVAVKIFHTKEEASWCHEMDIYQTCLIRHPNILRFIAADNKDIGISTQLWLITEYCEKGSLYDVLQESPIDEDLVLKFCFSTASGLAHLHTDIIGTEGKPAIAHRDIKTRNILVKSDFSCCLADLGLALRYYRDSDRVEDPPTKRVGTRRYLSPEILNDSLNTSNFDCFKRSDIYSFGLVMWETARRGLCAGVSEDYQLPYFDIVNPDPSFEDMKKVVAVEKKRPSIPNRWSQSEIFHSLSQLIEQCWHHDGEARLTALRLKKNLANLIAQKTNQSKKTIPLTEVM